VQLEQCVLLFLGPLRASRCHQSAEPFALLGEPVEARGVLAHQLYEVFLAPSPWLAFLAAWSNDGHWALTVR
jgi:hypothetical protein